MHFAVVFIFDAQIIVEINPPFDDLAAAIAFDVEGVKMLFWFGRCAAEEVFEKALEYLPVVARSGATKRRRGDTISILIKGLLRQAKAFLAMTSTFQY